MPTGKCYVEAFRLSEIWVAYVQFINLLFLFPFFTPSPGGIYLKKRSFVENNTIIIALILIDTNIFCGYNIILI